MVNKPKQIGTAAETAVVRALRPRGFPDAERRALAGEFDPGDIVGVRGVCWEVKGGEAARKASDGQIEKWLIETERERINSESNIGILVVQRRGIGEKNAHRWWAITPYWSFSDLVVGLGPSKEPWSTSPVRLLLEDMCAVLRYAGYGEPLEEIAA